MQTKLSRLCLLAVSAVGVVPEVALACSGPDCSTPAELVLSESGLVPANFAELTAYRPDPYPYISDYDVRVWEESDPSRVLFRGKIRRSEPTLPIGPLSAGMRYVAEATPDCDYRRDAKLFRFQAGAAQEAPRSLGPLRVAHQGATRVPWGGGSLCWDDIDANAAELELDAMALPEAWRGLLTQYQLMVDGTPFSWRLTIAGGGDALKDAPRGFYGGHPGLFQVWTRCGPWPERVSGAADLGGVEPGLHQVWVRARVPSSEPSYVESERVEVELRCSASEEADDGADPADDEEESPDQQTTPNTGDGCSLGDQRHRADSVEGSVVSLVLALGVLLVRRRRR